MRLSSLLLAASLGWAAASPTARQTQVCNGHAEFCSRKYSNITLIGAHDSGFVGPIIDPRVDQELDVTAQLNAGIRMVEAQTHVLFDTLSLCHTSCLELYAGSLADYVTKIVTWLDQNPNEVVTMLITNGDYVNASMFDAVYNATGAKKYAYVPPTAPNVLPIDEWPTLAEMIAADKRLVILIDYDANMVEYPYILDEFAYFFETPYDTTDPSFPECSINRPPGASPDGRMYIVNHFLDTNVLNSGVLIPDNVLDYQTNAATGNGSIGAQAALCVGLYGREPNFVLVDFFDRGNVFVAQDQLNGLPSS